MKRLLLAALLLAGACSSDPPVSHRAPTASSDASPAVSRTQTPMGTLVLEVDGLGVDDGAGHVRHLPFATTSADVAERVLRPVLGSSATSHALPDCGQGPRTSYGVAGFTLLLDKTAWVGWTSRAEGITTADGIGVGVTRAAVERAGTAVTFSQSSLGTEFTAEDSGFGGLMSGPAKSDKVTTVYSGETCFAR